MLKQSRVSKLSFFFLCCLLLLLAACGGTTNSSSSSSSSTPTNSATQKVSLKVFAAASLTESFNQIKTQYQNAHPNVTITYNFAGSQALEQQLASGAPADVFASADTKNMQKASQAGLVNSSQVFARNKVVVILPISNPGKITTLHDLSNKGVKIDIADPSVPVGEYTVEVLNKMKQASEYGASYVSSVQSNVISREDNDKAIVTKVELGDADAGFVYESDLTAAALKKVKVIDIPDTYNVIATYPIATVKNSANAQAASAFVQYILSSDGQAVLQQYHFLAA
jgi:molybdate transport system substrate-binding protein